jgi:SAM-dependent methyltransferase
VLAPYVTKIVGVDASEGMVGEYNKKAQEAGIPPEKMSARAGNILGDSFSEDFKGPEYHDFDVAFVGLALHHFSDPLLSMKRLVDRLRVGGVLWIIDVPDQPHAHHEHEKLSPETKAAIHTHGFTVDQVKDLFAQAGAGADVRVDVIDKPFEIKTPNHTFKRTVFFARGQKL